MTKWILCLVALTGCSAGQLERKDNSPLTREIAEQYNRDVVSLPDDHSLGNSQPVVTRFDLGKMSLVYYGRVVDSNLIQLTGTIDRGLRTGAAAGGLNALNSGTTSTESIVLRVLGGALVGAAIESTLTDGQAFEYFILRNDGQLISTINRSRLNRGDCLLIRTDPSNSNTFLEVKASIVCEDLGLASNQVAAGTLAVEPPPSIDELESNGTGITMEEHDATPVQPDARYTIGVQATRNDHAVDFIIETNIPGTIEVMAGLDLSGQAASDVYIGKKERVRVVDGRARFSIDASDLPQGRYDAVVAFYPRWGFQDTTSRQTGITTTIEAIQRIDLAGSGMSATERQERENAQKWVIENVSAGYAWDEATWSGQFGSYRELPVRGLNPNVIHAYYFAKLDMTIFVNMPKRFVSHWRIGKASR